MGFAKKLVGGVASAFSGGGIGSLIGGGLSLLGKNQGRSSAAPQASAGSFLIPNVNITNQLGTAKQTIGGSGTANNTFTFSPEGQELQGLFRSLTQDAEAANSEFDTQGTIDNEFNLLQKLLGPQKNNSINRLFDQVNASTGGLFSTSGGNEAISNLMRDLGLNDIQTALTAIGSGRGEEQRRINNANNAGQLETGFLNSGLGLQQLASSIASSGVAGASAKFNADNQDRLNEADANAAFWSNLGSGFATNNTPTPTATPPIIINNSGGGSAFGAPSRSAFSPFSQQRQFFGSSNGRGGFN